MTLWAGRVGAELAPEVWDFLRAQDDELLPYDVQGTLIHAGRLHAAGLLDDGELAEVRDTLGSLDEVDGDDEDVHSAIERLLGEVGRKIHAGRSRNDQVAAAFRLYVADACREASTLRSRPSRVPILERAAEEADDAACPATRTCSARSPSPSAITCSPGSRCSSATARASRSRAGRLRPRRSARARSPARRCRSRRRRTRCGTRWTPSPTATSRSTTCTRARDALRAPVADRRGARALDDAASSASRGCRRTPRRARR